MCCLAPDAERLAKAVRQHWGIENRAHWCLDVAFADGQTLNLIRLEPVKRKGSFKTKRIIAATSDDYRAQLLGLE